MSTISEKTIQQKEWWKKAVFYQIYPRSFKDSSGNGIGDLQGIIEKLDYLNDGTEKSLGIDAIWFSPFFVSPQKDYGYDIADYCSINPEYGTMDDYDQLVTECHRRGIRVMLDLVVNHTSEDHEWFKQSRSSIDNPYRDWYIWKNGRRKNKPPNNWKSLFAGSAWTKDHTTGQYYLHSFLKEQPDLNWFNPQVREAIYKVLHFWLQKGADGFRLDVAHTYCKDETFADNPPVYKRVNLKGTLPLKDRSLEMVLLNLLGVPKFHHPETHLILQRFRKILNLYPEKTSVGEIQSEDPAVVASYYGNNNDELHMNFYLELAQNKKWKAKTFQKYIDLWENLLPSWAWPAYTFSNHDVIRAISRFGKGNSSDDKARILAMMLLSLRCTPFIYYGEEIGMKFLNLPLKERKDPVGIRYYPFQPGRDGARTPMQWDGGEKGGFTTGEPWLPLGPEAEKRNVEMQDKDPSSLLNFYRRMIHLRKNCLPLQEGSYRSLQKIVPQDCYAYKREWREEMIIVALNFGNRFQKIDLSSISAPKKILLSTDYRRQEKKLDKFLELQPTEGCILHVTKL